MGSTRNRLALIAFLLLLPALACNMPRGGTPTPSDADVLRTQAAETVAAQLTQVAQPPATSIGLTPGVQTPLPTISVPTLTPPLPASPTATRVPATPTAVSCDRIKFVKDVNYPDNTEVAAGTSFVKTWRLQNDGSCTWTTGYALVFTGGDAMGAPSAAPLPGNVGPGQTIDLSVSLTAPTDGGTYRGEFKLRNASNVVFGLGDGNRPFWVQIKVPVATGLLFDFLGSASEAEWSSGFGAGAGSPLAFGGAADDPNGSAGIVDGVKMETGATSGKILLNFPKHETDGWVKGIYPAFTVQNGDRLKGKLGFLMNPGDVCGLGNVTFQIQYKEGDTVKSISEWSKTCTGRFTDVDIDLSGLKGKSIRFILTVKSNGPFTDDWAIWNSLRVVH